MRAMILAAGRGKRMGDLTTHVPKPLLKLGEQYLIEYNLKALAKAGHKEIVINTSYLADQIKNALGDGSRYGVAIEYSFEETALETGGGIFQALSLLGDKPFVVVSADIVTEYPFEGLPKDPAGLGHLVLVDNPSFHPEGDFNLLGQRLYDNEGMRLTFGNIGVYRKELFDGCEPGCFPLNVLFHKAIKRHQLTGEYYRGGWHNIGTPEELVSAQNEVSAII
jgi:MurNAc alpha-1-phosphate uridylyltransferase